MGIRTKVDKSVMSSHSLSSEAPSLLYSPLYCRYNGFLFGLFFMHVFLNYQSELYEMQRMRMTRFLQEVVISLDLPSTHHDSRVSHYSLATKLLKAFLSISRSLFNHAVLGMTAGAPMVLGGESDDHRNTVLRILREENLLFDLRAFERIFESLEGKRTVNKLVTGALGMGRRILESVVMEPESCFVAMPFTNAFEDRYIRFYRPLIHSLGLRPIRGWGGLILERYQPLLRLVIEKCGILLGELTTVNPNVLYEIGVAHAFGRPTILLFDRIERGSVSAVSNLGSHIRLPYSSDASEWWTAAIQRNLPRIRRYHLIAE